MYELSSLPPSTVDKLDAVMQVMLCSTIAECEESARLQSSNDNTAQERFGNDMNYLNQLISTANQNVIAEIEKKIDELANGYTNGGSAQTMDEDKYSLARMPREVNQLLVTLIGKVNVTTRQNDAHFIDQIKNIIHEEMLSQTEISYSVALKVQVQALRSLRHLLMNYCRLSDSSSQIVSRNIDPSTSNAAQSTPHVGLQTRHDHSPTRPDGPPTKRLKT